MLVFCTRDYRLQSPFMLLSSIPRQGQINLPRNLEMFPKESEFGQKKRYGQKETSFMGAGTTGCNSLMYGQGHSPHVGRPLRQSCTSQQNKDMSQCKAEKRIEKVQLKRSDPVTTLMRG